MIPSKTKYLTMCYLTAFIAGFCVMVVELIAGRLIARYLGVSLYTWTSVIGVVLAGIALGNYIGGRIADRFHPEKALSVLFVSASASCALIPVMNNLIGVSPILLQLSWPLRITLHVAMIFFFPSCILGMISPVVAKFALDQGLTTGRTIGNIYAWGVGGSILGTFITGFFLIAHVGSIAVVWIIAGGLGLIGLLYSRKSRFPYIWLAVLLCLTFVSFSDLAWAKKTATNIFLREANKEDVVYEKDTQYSYISVNEIGSGVYEFMMDGLTHSRKNLDEPTNIDDMYGYHKVFAEIAMNTMTGKKPLSLLNLGGGGYVFPIYIERSFPGSRIEVVEVDPGVTEAAVKAFGLSEENNIGIHHLDARNYVEDMIRRKENGEETPSFDLIYNDAISGLAIPYHLITHEFNEKISGLLAPDGLYVSNMVDSGTTGEFLSAMVNTMREVFPHVYVIRPPQLYRFRSGYHTYVLIASSVEIDKDKITSNNFSGEMLTEEELKALKDGSGDIIFTDDFAPVENLLKEAFSMQGERMLCEKMIVSAKKCIERGELERAIGQFKKVLRIDPDFVEAHNNIGSLKAWQGEYGDAIVYYDKALSIEPGFTPAMMGLGNSLDLYGRRKEAIEVFYKILEGEPDYANAYVSLGNALFKAGRMDKAIKNYKKALTIDPSLKTAADNLDLAIAAKEKTGQDGNEPITVLGGE